MFLVFIFPKDTLFCSPGSSIEYPADGTVIVHKNTYIIGFTKTSDGIFMILQVACPGNCFPDSCHNGYRVLFFLVIALVPHYLGRQRST